MAGLTQSTETTDGSNDASGSSAAFEILWNPERWAWDIDEFRMVQKSIEAGDRPVLDWSTGARKQGIQPDDRIFLFLVGSRNRGLLASGRAVENIKSSSHWDGTRDETTTYIDVEWDTLLDPSEVLPWHEILFQVPGFPEKFQSGGQSISGSLLPALENIWGKHKATVSGAGVGPEIQTGYHPAVVKRRKHQAAFRKLLFAHYPHKCIVCGFDQINILEAAHIISDAEGGPSSVENGRLMCPNHHRAHDAGLFKFEGGRVIWSDAGSEFLEPVRPWKESS